MKEENKIIETTEAVNQTVDEKPEKPKKAKKSGGKISAFFKSRKTKHGSLAVAIVALFVAAIVAINVIFGILIDRFPGMELDLTANNSYALQQETIDYVSSLDKDVIVTVLVDKETFTSQGSYFVQAVKLLEKMENCSNGKLTVKYIDTSTDPTFTSNYPDLDWSSSNNYIAIVECGEQYKALDFTDCFAYDEESYYYYGELSYTATTIEQAVIVATANVTAEDKVKVDVITGNQEQDYSTLTSLLSDNSFEINEVSLATGDLNDDSQFAILFSPAVDLDESSVEKLEAWLDNDGKNGKSLIYIPYADKLDTPNLDTFLSKWGMEVNDGYVFETDTQRLLNSSTAYTFIVDYTDYYIDGLKNPDIPVAVANTHNIIITDEDVAHALLTTSEDKAGVMPYDADDSWDYEKSISDTALNVAAEGTKENSDGEKSNVIVFGSFTMFSKSVMQYNSFNNSGYIVNLFNTIAEKNDESIIINSQSMDSAELGITSVATQSVMMIIFVIALPLAVFAVGIIMWIRRRNR